MSLNRKLLAAMMSAGLIWNTSALALDIPPDILNEVQQHGDAQVMVKLNVPWQPEGQLTEAQRTAQRAAIQQSQTQFETELQQDVAALQNGLDGPSVGRETPLTGLVQAKYQTVPYLMVQADALTLEALANNSVAIQYHLDVLDGPSLTEGLALIGATTAQSQGYQGSGQTVAIIDSGVTHPTLTPKVVAEGCFSTTVNTAQGLPRAKSVCPSGQMVQTGQGSGAACRADMANCDHGTHVAGIVAGTAPQAKLVTMQVFSEMVNGGDCLGYSGTPCARSYSSDQVKALEEVYRLQQTGMSIAAVNMSINGGVKFSGACDSDPRKAMIDNLLSVGVVTAVSAGNDGYTDGLTAPACISSVVAVGATDKVGNFANYSNQGTELDFLAPGSNIVSTLPNGGTGAKSGTSMAAPFVAGAYAMLKSVKPTASIVEISQALKETAKLVNGEPLIQVAAAVEKLLPPPAKPCTQWNLNTDYLNSPNQKNPNPDSCGNQNVWHFMQGTSSNHDPKTYSLMSKFTTAANRQPFYDPAFFHWAGEELASAGGMPFFGRSSQVNRNFGCSARYMPANTIVGHPASTGPLVIGWRSPVTGTVSVTGGTTSLDGGTIIWYVDKGATNLAYGWTANGSSQYFQYGTGGGSLANVKVQQGDFLYLGIDPAGNFSCDTTSLGISINLVPVPKVTLTVTKTGNGQITGNGITCGTDCTEDLAPNTQVTLTATATTGSMFKQWTGDCTGTTATVTVTMDKAKSCSATFELLPVTYTLNVTKTGNGNLKGTGIDCGTDCTEANLAANTQVTLTATPDTGYQFVNWGGACTGTDPTTTVTLTADQTCAATFELIPPPAGIALTLNKADVDKGRISGRLRGETATSLNCDNACQTASYNYPKDGVVIFIATADKGYEFKTWTCTGSSYTQDPATPNILKVTMTTATTCTANFDAIPGQLATLTVNLIGTGNGTVISNKAGLTCSGQSCTGTYVLGQKLTVTATPSVFATFLNWGGDCTGNNAKVSLTLTKDLTCTAQFQSILEAAATELVKVLYTNGFLENNADVASQFPQTTNQDRLKEAFWLAATAILQADSNLAATQQWPAQLNGIQWYSKNPIGQYTESVQLQAGDSVNIQLKLLDNAGVEQAVVIVIYYGDTPPTPVGDSGSGRYSIPIYVPKSFASQWGW